MIGWIGGASQQALLDCSINEFYCAVVLEEHARGHMRDSGLELIRHSADALEKLILLRPQPSLLGSRVAKVEKAAQLKAEFSEALEIGACQLCFTFACGWQGAIRCGQELFRDGSHRLIVTQYIALR